MRLVYALGLIVLLAGPLASIELCRRGAQALLILASGFAAAWLGILLAFHQPPPNTHALAAVLLFALGTVTTGLATTVAGCPPRKEPMDLTTD